MQLSNNYYYFKSALNNEQCDYIIEKGKDLIDHFKSKKISTKALTKGDILTNQKVSSKALEDKTLEQIDNADDYYVRDSNCVFLNDENIYKMVFPFVTEANKKAGWNYNWDYSEAAQFTTYEKGGFYGWHIDGSSDWNSVYKKKIAGITPENNPSYVDDYNYVGKVRKLSLTINLNYPEEYEGGNLKFDFGPHSKERFKECIEIKPRGSIIVFPSFIYHQVTPVTRGTRYSLVMWLLGRPLK